jgi:hypothetical protein
MVQAEVRQKAENRQGTCGRTGAHWTYAGVANPADHKNAGCPSTPGDCMSALPPAAQFLRREFDAAPIPQASAK